MFGGNPNQTRNPFQPLAPHHLKQQLGTHNNQGLAGITAGQNAVQPPAGQSSNSLPQVQAPAPSPAMPLFPRIPYQPGVEPFPWLPGLYQPPTVGEGDTLYDMLLQTPYGDMLRNYNRILQLQGSVGSAARAGAAQQERELRQQRLIQQRDQAEAQRRLPRSGTHVFHGF